MVQWADFPFDAPMFLNADEAILRTAVATIENATANPAGGMSRFPGLRMFSSFSGQRVYGHFWNDNLYAATDEGRLYRIRRDGAAEDVTGVPISGGRRVIFDATEDRLVMAAGGPILQLFGDRTEVLSRDAPNSTHVVFVDSYLIAIEPLTQQFYFCDPGEYEVWNPLSVFSANAKPTPITAAVVTPYRELLLAGSDHIEQFERLPNGTQPFTRRWSTGEGVAYPYTLTADKTGTYGVNLRSEFVRFAGQVSQDQSQSIGMFLQSVDDWTDAWSREITVADNHVILLQMPEATNAYGTKGITLIVDYTNRRWSFLFGYDGDADEPVRFPIWSATRAWGRIYCGVDGGLAELDPATFDLLGQPYPFHIRSGHVDKFGPSRIDNVRIRVKRGVGDPTARAPLLGMRVNRDNEGFNDWSWEPMGVTGDGYMTVRFGGQGCANTWQFEIRVTDPVDVQFVGMQVQVERLSW